MTLLEHVNGKRGRVVPPLPEHTFKDSGITIRIRKVSPMAQQRMAQAIQQEMPEPEPPIVETPIGPESNSADPAYLAAQENWKRQTALELNRRMMTLAALESEVTIDDAARGDIARTRRHLKLSHVPYEDDPDLTPEENERVFYILYVACASPEDLREFGQAVTARSTPTEEAVQRHIATFPDDVPEP